MRKKYLLLCLLQWLKKNLDNNEHLVIVDLRTEEAYNKGHIKNAVNMPGLESLFMKDDWKMPKLDFLKKLFSEAGIDKDSLVVAYDNGDFFWSARLYWILEVLGHTNVGLLKYSYGTHIQNTLPTNT